MVRMAMPLSEMGFVGLNLADKGEARLGVDELLSSPALSPRMAKLPLSSCCQMLRHTLATRNVLSCTSALTPASVMFLRLKVAFVA